MRSMVPMDVHDRLSAVLEAQVASADSLRDVLAREQLALRDTDIDALDAAVASKIKVTEHLSQLERETRELLNAAGLSSEPQSFDRSIAACDYHGKLATKQARLRRALAECRNANDVNGRIVAWQQHRVRGAISILTGSNAATSIYGSNGRVDGELESTRLASA